MRHATEELNHIIWEVEEMMHHDPQSEAYFQNYTAYVYGDATLDDAFAEIGRETAIQSIAAIVWDADNALTAEMLNGITNPNLLVYVTEASKAPAGVQNVVINGVAEEIILTDATGNNNFYCPQSFTARSISYSRDFSQTTEIEFLSDHRDRGMSRMGNHRPPVRCAEHHSRESWRTNSFWW